MTEKRIYRFPKLLKLAVAILLVTGILILSVSAVGNNEKEKISDVRIDIQNDGNHLFINKQEVLTILEKAAGRKLKNQPAGKLDLSLLENKLKEQKWIKKAELYVDNQNVLRVNIEQRVPVARVFTVGGNSFYLSENIDVLPVREGVTVQLPVFTSFSGTPSRLRKQDSLLLEDICRIAGFVENNSFWMAQIDQIDITGDAEFEMIPKLGNQVIRFGNADNCEEKFSKLLAFYKQVMVHVGWNKYSIIDVQYKDQVVAERRDAAQVKADSLATVRIMKGIIESAKKNADDSTRIQLSDKPAKVQPRAQQRIEDDDNDVIQEVIPDKKAGSDDKGESVPKQTENEPKSDNAKPMKLSIDKKSNNAKKENVQVKGKPAQKNDDERKLPKAVMPPKNSN